MHIIIVIEVNIMNWVSRFIIFYHLIFKIERKEKKMKIKNYEDIKTQAQKANLTQDDFVKAAEGLFETTGRNYFTSVAEIKYFLGIFNEETVMVAHKYGADDSCGYYEEEGLFYIF